MSVTMSNDGDESKPVEATQNSKLNRLKFSIERGLRSPTMDIHQLRRPSSFFRSTRRGSSSHRRQKSLDENLHQTKSPQESPIDTPLGSPSPSHSINELPEIRHVSDFGSPTRSNDSEESVLLGSPGSPLQSSKILKFTISDIPEINILSEVNDTKPLSINENVETSDSKFLRLKRRTLSMFFDQELQKLEIDDDDTVNVRPPLAKSLSDSKQRTIKDNKNTTDDLNKSPTKEVPQELLRKRSRTMGSLETDLYHKRNGSLVRTIGSMVMLKPRQNSSEILSTTPEPQSSSTSESSSVIRLNAPPELTESDTPETYITKLLDEGYESEITVLITNDDSEFMKASLDFFMQERFDFTNEPLDIALRKLLVVCELPKETQQIDRVLSSFSLRYFVCNSDLWDNSDQIYFLVFSFVMLHTDQFNSNNKKKMSKEEFIKNTRVDSSEEKTNNSSLTKEIFEYYYDNITHTKFIKKSSQTAPSFPPQPLYLLPKRIFSSASSTNLEGMANNNTSNNTTVPISNQRSQSISSSTSQFFSSNQIDPYYYIFNNQLDALKLKDLSYKDRSPFANRLRNAFPESYFTEIRHDMTSPNGIYIRFNKECNWLPKKTEIRFKSDEEIEYGKRCLVRVVKISELYREETIKNTKFFTIGTSSRVIWKKCYGVLTTCGFFIFENLNFLLPSDREKILEDYSIEEPVIIDILYDHILRSCSKAAINGLFSCQSTDDDHHTFNIFSTNRKELFSTKTFSEMSSWILAINYIASLDSCYIDTVPHQNHEVFPIRNISIEDKIIKLSKNIATSSSKIKELLRLQHHLGTLTPFSGKTKEKLLAHYQSIDIRVDWLWYEVERNQVYIDMLKHELVLQDDAVSLKTDDNESFLEDSFINEENLKRPLSKQDLRKSLLASFTLDDLLKSDTTEGRDEFAKGVGAKSDDPTKVPDGDSDLDEGDTELFVDAE